MSFLGAVGTNASDSGLMEVLESAFSGISRMLLGKRLPQNLRVLQMLTEVLRGTLLSNIEIKSMDSLQLHLDHLLEKN